MLYAFVVAVFLFSLQGIKLPTLQIGSYAGKLVRSVRCLSAHFDFDMRAMTGKRTVIIKICFGALWGGGGIRGYCDV